MSNTDLGPLPEKPSLDQLRKQAKELRASHASLSEAQLALARAYGFPSWPKLKLHTEQTTLRRLIEQGETEALRKLLSSSPRLAKLPFPEGDWPIHVAAEYNDPAMIEMLVGAGAPLDTRYEGSAHNALSWAVTCWSFEAGIKLIQLGVVPDLFCAAGLGLLEVVKLFWKDGELRGHPSQTGSSRFADSGERLPRPPLDARDQVSDALYIACRANRLEVARWLLDHGADPNWRGYAGASCLAWAEFAGDASLCALLRSRGGLDTVVDQQFRAVPKVFALMVLASWGFGDNRLRDRLLLDPSMVDARGEYGTLLNAAAYNGQMASVRVLVELGADRSARNAAGLTPAEVAEARGHGEVAAFLRG